MEFCGADQDRTDDLLNAIQALSQLSYGPIHVNKLSEFKPLLVTNNSSFVAKKAISKEKLFLMYRQKEESSDKRTIEYLKDEIREYKRQIKVLKRTIEELKK